MTISKNTPSYQNAVGRLAGREVLACLNGHIYRLEQTDEFMDEIQEKAYSTPDLQQAVGDTTDRLSEDDCIEVLSELYENYLEELMIPDGSEGLDKVIRVHTGEDDQGPSEGISLTDSMETADRIGDWREFACLNLERLDYETLRSLDTIDIEWEEYFQEPLEHWLVTEWFGRKLRDKGEIVYNLDGLSVWGRTCSGRTIKMDGVVEEIARDMEILPGQKYYDSWDQKE